MPRWLVAAIVAVVGLILAAAVSPEFDGPLAAVLFWGGLLMLVAGGAGAAYLAVARR